MRAARWILGIAGAVALLAVAAALMATLLIDPDHYKGALEKAVQRETGRPLVLEGHLRLTWLPWLGVRTGSARLGAPAGAGGPDLLDWQSAEVRVRLLPLLLHRRLEVARIRMVGADFHLERGPHGEGNWEDLIARLRAGSGAEAPSAAGHAAAPKNPWSASFAGLDLEHGSLDYLDQRSGKEVSLSDWDLSAGPWRAGEPWSLRTSFLLRAGPSGTRDPATSALRLPAGGLRVSLDARRLRISTSPLSVAAPQWTLRAAGAKLEGALDARRDDAGRWAASGSIQAAVASLRELTRKLGVGMPRTADPAALENLSLSAGWRYGDGGLEVRPLTARLDATTVTGWVTWSGQCPVAAGAGSPDALRFGLRADQVDLGRYLTPSTGSKPLELPVRALRALSAQGTLELEQARIDGTSLKNVRLEVQ